MRLLDCTLRPGKIIEISKEFPSYIKVEAPGLFSKYDSSGNDNTSKLPFIRPFFEGNVGTNGFIKKNVGEEVWILNNESNPTQLYWINKNEDNTGILKNEIFKQENDKTGFLDNSSIIECVVFREAGAGYASLYFSDGTGWIIRGNGNGGIVQIRKDGSVKLGNESEENRIIDICSDSISLGKEGGSDHPAALADKVQECLNLIQQCLHTMKQVASGNAYTVNIATAIGSFPDRLKSKIPDILSKQVTLQ